MDRLTEFLNTPGKILILGFGNENKQFYQWLTEVCLFAEEKIIVADKNTNLELPEGLPVKNRFLGEKYLNSLDLENVDWVVKSPGIWSLLPKLEEFRKRRGVGRIINSMTFFLERFSERIIGVTGTKGKSTTSSIVSHLIENCLHQKAHVCGNTSNLSPYNFWLDLKQKPQDTWFVLELSSFQLQDLGYSEISPKFAIISNYYLDHQDQHASPNEYWQAKDNIFLFQENGTVIYNQQVLDFSPNKELLEKVGIKVTQQIADDLSKDLTPQIQGQHNMMNLALAIGCIKKISQAYELPISEVELQKAVAEYKGLPHRSEIIRTIKISHPTELEIIFVDDGYATQIQAVAAGLKAFLKPDTFVSLWIAGIDKGIEPNILINELGMEGNVELNLHGQVGKTIYQNLPKVYTKAYCAEKFRTNLESFFDNNWLPKTLEKIKPLGKIKTVVFLFSPGGSSFDEFNNQLERANLWVKTVTKLNGRA